jgi:hypothetical protein
MASVWWNAGPFSSKAASRVTADRYVAEETAEISLNNPRVRISKRGNHVLASAACRVLMIIPNMLFGADQPNLPTDVIYEHKNAFFLSCPQQYYIYTACLVGDKNHCFSLSSTN